MILSNLTVPLLGLVDTAILGHLPQAYYLGAVALAAIIFDMLFWLLAYAWARLAQRPGLRRQRP